MASPQQPATMETLPGEVLSNIFIRLLAKQLAQMRCVCKEWNGLLSESSFVKSHLHHSTHNNDEILLFFYNAFSFDEDITFTARTSKSPHLKLTNIIKLPVGSLSNIWTRGDVIGSVNGLISFIYRSNYDFVFYIWNPSLSAVLTLPPNPLPFHGYGLIGIFPRFGFDPKSDDYKIVKVTGVLRPSRFAPSTKEWLQVEVFSMRKGSWESITQRFPSHVACIEDQDEVCVDGHDGHVHWLGYIDENLKLQTIVSFDLSVETFSEIPLPDSVCNRCIELGVLSGKLCVMSGSENGECEVWVMDEYGVAESWTKHYLIPQFSSGRHSFGFTLHNEFLSHDENYYYTLYDPTTNKAKIFQIPIPGIFGIHRIVGYVDSLVWVAPAERELSCCSISGFKFQRGVRGMLDGQDSYKRKGISAHLDTGYIYFV